MGAEVVEGLGPPHLAFGHPLPRERKCDAAGFGVTQIIVVDAAGIRSNSRNARIIRNHSLPPTRGRRWMSPRRRSETVKPQRHRGLTGRSWLRGCVVRGLLDAELCVRLRLDLSSHRHVGDVTSGLKE